MKFDKNKILDFFLQLLPTEICSPPFFFIFTFFTDKTSLPQRKKYQKKKTPRPKKIPPKNNTTDSYNRRIEELKSNKSVVEQIAREQYLMSKPNEDIYIIERPSVEND